MCEPLSIDVGKRNLQRQWHVPVQIISPKSVIWKRHLQEPTYRNGLLCSSTEPYRVPCYANLTLPIAQLQACSPYCYLVSSIYLTIHALSVHVGL